MRTLFFALLSCSLLQAQTYKTNIRFAAKPAYNEITRADRLTSNDTEISQKAFQMEGPAWENERVGFRNYFDARNGMDIWGKKTKALILDSVGIQGDYHSLAWWGMDILKVGNSLGAGSIALMIGDSIYRIGPGSKGSYRLLFEKPNQSSFELKFENWKIQDRAYTITQVISISAGTRFYESTVKIDGGKGDEYLITGIVNLQSKECLTIKEKKWVTIATHDKQAYAGEYLGMAVMAPQSVFKDTLTAPFSGPGITNTYMVKMKPDNKKEIRFRFYSCWELENNKFADRKYFLEFLKEEMSKGGK